MAPSRHDWEIALFDSRVQASREKVGETSESGCALLRFRNIAFFLASREISLESSCRRVIFFSSSFFFFVIVSGSQISKDILLDFVFCKASGSSFESCQFLKLRKF